MPASSNNANSTDGSNTGIPTTLMVSDTTGTNTNVTTTNNLTMSSSFNHPQGENVNGTDHRVTTTQTLIMTITIPVGTTTTGIVIWSTALQTEITVQIALPSNFADLSDSNHGLSQASIVGVVFGTISFFLLLLGGLLLIFRRRLKKKYTRRLSPFPTPYSTSQVGPGISHLRTRSSDLGYMDEISEETVVPQYNEHGEPGQAPTLYTQGQNARSSSSSFVTISSVPVPFYQRIKEARRAGRKFMGYT